MSAAMRYPPRYSPDFQAAPIRTVTAPASMTFTASTLAAMANQVKRGEEKLAVALPTSAVSANAKTERVCCKFCTGGENHDMPRYTINELFVSTALVAIAAVVMGHIVRHSGIFEKSHLRRLRIDERQLLCEWIAVGAICGSGVAIPFKRPVTGSVFGASIQLATLSIFLAYEYWLVDVLILDAVTVVIMILVIVSGCRSNRRATIPAATSSCRKTGGAHLPSE